MSIDKRLLSVEEAAAYVGYAPGTLRNRIYKGTLPFQYIKDGKKKVLFDQRDLDHWIDTLPRHGREEV